MVTSVFQNPARFPEEGNPNLQHTLNRALREAYAEAPAAAAGYARQEMNVHGEPGRIADSPAQTLAKLNGMLGALAAARGVPAPADLQNLLSSAGSGMNPRLAERVNYFLLSLANPPARPHYTPPVRPSFQQMPSITPNGAPVGSRFRGDPGVYTGAGAVSLRWLLDGQPVGSGSTYVSTRTGTLQFRVIVAGPGGVATALSNAVAVGVVVRAAAITLNLSGVDLTSLGPKRGAGVLALALGAPQLAGEFDVLAPARLARTLQGASVQGAAALLLRGTLTSTLQSATTDSATRAPARATAALTLQGVVLLSSSAGYTQAMAGPTLQSATAQAAARLTLRGAATFTLQSATTQSGTQAGARGAAAFALLGAQVSATARSLLAGTGARTLAPLTASAAGTVIMRAAAPVSLAGATVGAAGTVFTPVDSSPAFGSERMVWGSDEMEFG